MNGEEYCQSEFMLQNEESCKASSCCQWNTWEEGDASFNGQGRCWSDIGAKMCTDIFEGSRFGESDSYHYRSGMSGRRHTIMDTEKSVGSSSRYSCMDQCQRDGNNYMTCMDRCERAEQSVSDRDSSSSSDSDDSDDDFRPSRNDRNRRRCREDQYWDGYSCVASSSYRQDRYFNEKSVGSSSYGYSCMDQCQRDGHNYMSCMDRCPRAEESVGSSSYGYSCMDQCQRNGLNYMTCMDRCPRAEESVSDRDSSDSDSSDDYRPSRHQRNRRNCREDEYWNGYRCVEEWDYRRGEEGTYKSHRDYHSFGQPM